MRVLRIQRCASCTPGRLFSARCSLGLTNTTSARYARGMQALPAFRHHSSPSRATMSEAGPNSGRRSRGGRGSGRGGSGQSGRGGRHLDSRNNARDFATNFQDESIGNTGMGYPPVSPGKRQRNPSSQNLSNPDAPPGPGGRNRNRRGGRGGGRAEGLSLIHI